MATESISLLPTKKNVPVAAINPAQTKRHSRTVEVEIAGDTLILRLPLIPEHLRKPSKSGKTIICAGTAGTRGARQRIDGVLSPIIFNNKQMRICASAWVPIGAQITATEDEEI